MDYVRRSHSISLLTYHIVFVVKYRRPVLNDEITAFMKQHAEYLCGRFGASLISMESDVDHVHLLVSAPPSVAPSDLVRTLKTQLSKEVHLRPELDQHVKQYLFDDRISLWQPSYFIATTGTSVMEKVRAYIESQRTDEHKRKYVKSGRYAKKKSSR